MTTYIETAFAPQVTKTVDTETFDSYCIIDTTETGAIMSYSGAYKTAAEANAAMTRCAKLVGRFGGETYIARRVLTRTVVTTNTEEIARVTVV